MVGASKNDSGGLLGRRMTALQYTTKASHVGLWMWAFAGRLHLRAAPSLRPVSKELPYARYDPTLCLNCGRELQPSTRFCPRCGQRNREHRKSLLQWISEGLSTFFHLEGRTLRTLRDLPVPGRMPRNYLNGQRERYLHPLRLVLLTSLVCFAVMRAVTGGVGIFDVEADERPEALAGLAFAEALGEAADGEDFDFDVGDFDSLTVRRLIDSTRASLVARPADAEYTATRANVLRVLDSADVLLTREYERRRAGQVFGVVEDPALTSPMLTVERLRMRYANHERVTRMAAVAKTRPAGRDSATRALLDSFALAFPVPEDTYLPDTLLWGEPTGISTRQYATLSPEELVAASSLESWLNRVILAKVAQINQDGSRTVGEALTANVTLAVLLFIPMLAFGYWLLYWRRLPYYSQHLNVVAIVASMGLLLGTLATVAIWLGVRSATAWAVTVVAFVAYVYVTELRVYQYAWWKVALKTFALGVFGSVAFALALLLWVTISVLVI